MDMNSENKFDFVLPNISSEPKKSVDFDLPTLVAVNEPDFENHKNESIVEKKDLYKAIFKQSPVPSVVFDHDGTILLINDALERLYGNPMKQFVHRSSVEELFQHRQRKRIIDHYQHIFSKHKKSLQLIFQCHNGEKRIIELKINPIEDSKLLMATLTDLTAYKISEKRVQEWGERISLIDEIIVAINSKLNKDQLIQILFTQIRKIFSYDFVCTVICDLDERELDVHYSNEELEIKSYKGIGSYFQLFNEALSSLNHIEENVETVFKVSMILGLSIDVTYKSQLLIQLKTDEQLIGAILLFSKAENTLTRFHIDVFQSISDQIANTFLKVKLLQKYQQSLTNLSLLARINESLCSSLDLDVVLKQVVESSQQVMHAKICTIHFLEGEYNFSNALDINFKDNFIGRFKTQIHQVIIQQEPLIVENIDNNIQFFKNRDEIQKLGLQSLIVLPIVANRKTIAFLSVFLDKIHYFSEHELELLSTFANQAAIAIENAKLYSKVKQTKNYLESIIRSSADLIISTDMDGNTIFFSNRASILTGYDSEEILNRPFFDRFVKNGRTLFSGLKQELFKTDKVQSFECEILAKNNRTITISWSFSSLINQDNEIIGTLGIGKDISK